MFELEKCELLSSNWNGYELLDSGERLKLERFGDCIVIRSEPKAWWRKAKPELWRGASAIFEDSDAKRKGWKFLKKVSSQVLDCDGIKFHTKFMDGTKHLGVFPEQKPHWDYICKSAKNFEPFVENGTKVERPRLLNLFGYTGAATLFAAKGGFFATHVDASKPSVDWAKKNRLSSNLPENSVRWIVDDALKFVKRLARRGDKFEAIVLDPPAFGRGPKGELWKLEKMLPELLDECKNLFSSKKMFALMTLYSIDASPIMAANILADRFNANGKAKISAGELVLKPKNGTFALPLSIWGRIDFPR